MQLMYAVVKSGPPVMALPAARSMPWLPNCMSLPQGHRPADRCWQHILQQILLGKC